MGKTKNFRLLVSLMLAVLMVFNLTATAFGADTEGGVSLEEAKGYTLYMANGESFVHEGDDEVSAFMTVDKRFFTMEDVTMTLEIRQYNSDGYTVVGSEDYDYAALQTLMATADKATETAYTFSDVKIPVAEGKSFNAGWAEYCVVKFARPSWTDEEGKQLYKWTYTGDASVLAADAKTPEPIVWLYNLDANSHRGALIRSILAELNIPAGTVNHANLNQNIGYLVEWEGYEPVDNPYSDERYDVEYILMGNLTEVQLDDFIDGMQENNIRVNLKSVPTAWTAGKTFAELFDIMAEEDETMQAAVALDEMIYEAESLDEETYGSSPYWNEFKETLEKAIVALSTDAEESGEGAALYINAREALLDVYLKVTGKTLLAGDLELVLEQQAEGTYKVSAKLNGEQTGATFDYSWKPGGSTEKSIIVKAEELYKVNLEVKGTGSYYGELSAKLNVPGAPAFENESAEQGIAVKLHAYEAALNTPEVQGYVVELYYGGEFVKSVETTAAEMVVFDGLTAEENYDIKVYAYNVVGRSDIVEAAATAGAVSEEEPETDADDNNNADVDDDAQTEEETKTDADVDDKTDADVEEDDSEPVNTGDAENLAAWMMVLAVSAATGGMTMTKKRN